MKLRTKIPLAIAITIALMVAVIYLIGSKIILDSFANAERNDVLDELARVEAALERESASIQTMAHDYASWDATYNYMVDPSPEYLTDDSFENAGFANLKLDVVALIDTAGELVYGKAYKWQENINLPLPSKFLEILRASNFHRFENLKDDKDGIIVFPDDMQLIVANPILTSEEEGPIRGALLMGRRVDAVLLQRLSSFVKRDVTIVSDIDPRNLGAGYSDSYVSADGLKLVHPIDQDRVAGLVALTDVYGKPVTVLRIELPRITYNQGLATLYLLFFALVIVGALTTVLAIVLLDALILRRLARLSKNVESVPKNRVDTEEILISGRDEISKLSGVFAEAFEKLFLSKRQITQDRAKLNFIMQSMTDAVVAIDASRNIVLVNKSAERLTGYGREELIGRPYHEKIRFVQEKTSLPAEDIIDRFHRRNHAKRALQALSLQQKGGSKISVAESVAAVKDAHGGIIGHVMVLRNVTHERLAELERMKNEFLAIASHQLRTPLGVIKWTIETLLEGDAGELNPQQKQLLKNTVENNEKMILLINDFLSIVELQSKESPFLRKKRFSLNKMIASILEELNKSAPAREISMDASWPTNVLFFGDRHKLVHAFVSLFNNAMKHAPDLSPIIIGYKKEKKEIIVSIKNPGTGLLRKNKRQLFEKFFRAKNAQEYTPLGIGLDLFAARTIIEAHHGRVWFESSEKKGITFYVALPHDGL